MTGDPDRAAAARACRTLLEAARRSNEIRMMLAHVASNRGFESIYAYADAHPDAVIALAEEIASLEEQSK